MKCIEVSNTANSALRKGLSQTQFIYIYIFEINYITKGLWHWQHYVWMEWLLWLELQESVDSIYHCLKIDRAVFV